MISYFRLPRMGVIALLAALGIDQVTKQMALSALGAPGTTLAVLPFFDLTLVFNHGISFGLFNQAGPWNTIIFTAIAGAICLFLVPNMVAAKGPLPRIAFGLIIGGAIGNVIDRWTHGAVVDFISIHYNGHYFPIFNGADAFISIGVGFIFLDLLLKSEREGSSGCLL